MRQRALVSIGAFAAALLTSCSCGGAPERDENPERRELREIVLLHPPAKSGEPNFLEGSRATIYDVLRRLEEARTDPFTVALFVRIGDMGGAWGRVADVTAALRAIHDAGKPVHCHVESTDNAGYLLAASACDRLTVTPAGSLDTVGVSAQVFYARSLLDQLGVQADLLQVGAFKGAAEPFTRDAMSPQMRESLGAMLDDLQATLVRAMVERRNMTAERAAEVLDGGPYDSDSALAAGLVDAVEYDDEARTRAREAGHATRNVVVRLGRDQESFSLGDVVSALASSEPDPDPDTTTPHVALVYLTGEISDGENAGIRGAQAGPFVRRVRELAEDEHVRAVVLRIDSPGGSALASDRMWHAVRRVAAVKPVIVSVGDMAASGGYYVASAGHDILAHEGSIVGSIGVVGGKVTAGPLLERVGVHVETVTRGAHADWTSITTPFDEGEREILQRMMQRTYERFVQRIATGREMDPARVLESAEGRIWSGRDGLERGLVDRLGTLRDAITLARERASLGDDTPIVEWPSRSGMLEGLLRATQGGDADEAVAAQLMAAQLGPAADALSWARLLRDGETVFLALPIGLDVR